MVPLSCLCEVRASLMSTLWHGPISMGRAQNAAGGRIEMNMSNAIEHAKKHLEW